MAINYTSGKLFVKSCVLGGIIPILQLRNYSHRQLSDLAQGHELVHDRVRAYFGPQ